MFCRISLKTIASNLIGCFVVLWYQTWRQWVLYTLLIIHLMYLCPCTRSYKTLKIGNTNCTNGGNTKAEKNSTWLAPGRKQLMHFLICLCMSWISSTPKMLKWTSFIQSNTTCLWFSCSFSPRKVVTLIAFRSVLSLQGMTYLHKSVFESHGNLTSGECHVDSRWVLKIGGFALNSFEGEKEYAEVFKRCNSSNMFAS